MTKFLLLPVSALLLVLAPTAGAQTAFGVKAGLNVATLSNDGFEDSNPRLGFVGGVFANVPLSPSIALQPEVLYSQKGASADADLSGIGIERTTIAVDYVEIPVLLAFTIPTSSTLNLGVYAGPTAAFKVQDRVEYETSGEDDVEVDTDAFTSSDFGVAFGGMIGSGPFAVDLRYTLGLNDIVDEGGVFAGNETRNGVFGAMFQYTFGR